MICKIQCLEYFLETLPVTSNSPNDPVFFEKGFFFLKEELQADLKVDIKNLSYNNVFF